MDQILEQCKNWQSKSREITSSELAVEYLEYVENILTLKQIEKDLVAQKAINFGQVFEIINMILSNTEELKNTKEFKELNLNISKAHKYWEYLQGRPKQPASC